MVGAGWVCSRHRKKAVALNRVFDGTCAQDELSEGGAGA